MAMSEEAASVGPFQTDNNAYSIPPVAVSLIVDRMMEDQVPMGRLAEEDDWKNAYNANVADFYAMSLVHSTWTPIARRAVQRRAVVPHDRISRFLFSPLCGPWIVSMVVYWTIDNGFEGATTRDTDSFRALLERAPQLRSLAFISSLAWPYREGNERAAPPYRVSECLELVASLMPGLEDLRLRHVWRGNRENGEETMTNLKHGLIQSKETHTLFRQLPRLPSLKHLSITSWNGLKGRLEALQHPSLETVEIRYGVNALIYRTFVPGAELSLSSVRSRLPLDYDPWISDFSRLRQYKLHRPSFSDAEIPQNCSSLVHLELLLSCFLQFPVGTFPSSLEYLELRYLTQETFLEKFCPQHPLDSPTVRDFCDHIRALPSLRNLVVSEPNGLNSRQMEESLRPFYDQEFVSATQEEGHGVPQHPLIELCKERRIEFTVGIGKRTIRLC